MRKIINGYLLLAVGICLLLPLASRAEEPAFIRIVPSKPEVFLGEGFQVSYLLYCNVKAMEPDRYAELEFSNCFSRAYPADQHSWTETLNGKRYSVLVLKKYFLIPFKAGPLSFPALSINLKLTMPPAADDFFEQEVVLNKKLTTGKSIIHVKPLPHKESPLQFSNAVGDFKVSAVYQQSAGILSVKLNVSGTGNLKSFGLNFPELAAGMESLNAEHLEHDTLLADGLHAVYNFSCQVMTSYQGQYTIKPSRFLVFNPDTEKYMELTIPGFSWKVSTGAVKPKDLNGVAVGVKDALLLHTTLNQGLSQRQFFNSTTCYVFIFLIVALLVAGRVFDLKEKAKKANPALYRYRKARGIAMKGINRLLRIDPVVSDPIFIKGLKEILVHYLCARYDLDPVVFSLEIMKEKLNGMPVEIYEEVGLVLLEQNRFQFSNAISAIRNQQQDAQQLMELINKIEIRS